MRIEPTPHKDRPTSRRWGIVILVLVLLVGCLAGSTATLLVTRTPGEDSPEAGFARDMMVHHAQAVQMAEIVRAKTESLAMRTLATDIALAQQAQIGMMQGWLEVWRLSITGTKPPMSWMGHPTDGLMPGMATPEEIHLLYKASPEETDTLFLRLMIAHHRSAIPMAKAILKRTDRPEVRQLAEAVRTSQKGEITLMEGMLRDRVGHSAEVELKPQSGSHTKGSATLTEAREGVRVELRLEGLPKPDTMYLAHIHPGTCSEREAGAEHKNVVHELRGHDGAAEEEIEWPLSEVQSDAQEHGSSTTTLKDASMERIITGELKHLNVHAAGSGDPPVLACAEL